METPPVNQDTRAGIIGGLLFVFVGLSMGEIVKTALLAAVGAAVSFLVSFGLKWITKKWKGGK